MIHPGRIQLVELARGHEAVRSMMRVVAHTAKTADEEPYCHTLRALTLAFSKGISPIMAVEIARRAIPGHVRPSFQEVEQACRGGGIPAAVANA